MPSGRLVISLITYTCFFHNVLGKDEAWLTRVIVVSFISSFIRNTGIYHFALSDEHQYLTLSIQSWSLPLSIFSVNLVECVQVTLLALYKVLLPNNITVIVFFVRAKLSIFFYSIRICVYCFLFLFFHSFSVFYYFLLCCNLW